MPAAMSFYTIILAAAVLTTMVASENQPPKIPCSFSGMCPGGYACVDGECIDCSQQTRRCLRSVERCRKLNCDRDEGCYIREEANYRIGTVFSMMVCAASNPCLKMNCGTSICVNKFLDDQMPVGQCLAQSAIPLNIQPNY